MTRLVIASAVVITAMPAFAGPYFFFDYGPTSFEYTRNANAASPGSVVGSITLQEYACSNLTAQKWASGPDGVSLTSDDVLLSSKMVKPFSMLFDVDVVYLGPNRYQFVGGGADGLALTGADGSATTAGNSFETTFSGDRVNITPIYGASSVAIAGRVETLSGNDAVLLNNDTVGDDWTFYGDSGDATSIGLSGSGDETRTSYNWGVLTELHLTSPVIDADDFFLINEGGHRVSLGAELMLTVVAAPPESAPAPAAVVLGCIGLGLIGWRMRRYT